MERYVKQLELGPMANFIYLVGAAGAREVAVVDPAWDVESILRAAEEDGKEITAALLTHHHHDHVNGVQPLLERKPGVRVYAQRAEIAISPMLQGLGGDVTAVGPGDRVEVGPVRITCVHTPGHTPGAQCFHFDEALVSGDTLFIGGCGRCDLEGGDPAALFDSIHRVLGALPDRTAVVPGHHDADRPVSTIGEEKATNPYFQRGDLASFVAYRMRPRT